MLRVDVHNIIGPVAKIATGVDRPQLRGLRPLDVGARLAERREQLLALGVEALVSRLLRIFVIDTVKLGVGAAARGAYFDETRVLLRLHALRLLVAVGVGFAERETLEFVFTVRLQTLHANLLPFVVVEV